MPTSKSRTSDLLLRQTRMHFPRLVDAEVKIAAIEKGGSDRKFYRVQLSPDHTIVVVKYNLEREENRHYVQIAEFLVANGIRAPKIYFHDSDEGLIWIEDLGVSDLWSYRDESWLVRRAFYESALDEVAKLHSLGDTERHNRELHLPAEFNSALYLWEQSYFFENCLGRYFGMTESRVRELSELPALQEIAERLAALPRVLVHRDFQSQNIIMRNAQAYLIDFQGMRPGLAHYDVASLLFDPYVTLSTAERTELLEHYCSHARCADDFAEILRLCAMQRLMQALGAYGFLGLVKGNSAFLGHIPAAMSSLRAVVSEIPGVEKLSAALSGVRAPDTTA
jgi:aminoglycoside/choline kinase family phosphotransferase